MSRLPVAEPKPASLRRWDRFSLAQVTSDPVKRVPKTRVVKTLGSVLAGPGDAQSYQEGAYESH